MRSVFFGLAVFFLAEDTANAERFTNSAIGVSIEKPSGWCALSADASAKDRQAILAANLQMRAAMPDDSYTPLYALTRSNGSYRVASTVTVGTVAAGPPAKDSGQERLQQTIQSMEGLATDVKVVTAPEVARLARSRAYHMAVTLRMNVSGRWFPIAIEMWAIRRGSYFLLVRTAYPADNSAANRIAVMKVVNSLQLSK